MDALPLPPPAEPFRVRISDPGEVAAAVPHLLGFHPRESVVLVALTGSAAARVGMCARADIPTRSLAVPVAQGLAEAMARSAPSAALIAIVSEEADGPLVADEPFDDPAAPHVSGLLDLLDLPHRDLVHELVVALDDEGIAVRDALLVRRGRWWSYDCPHSCCAPGAGTPLPDGVSPLAAASVAAGQVVAGDRSELLARIAPPDGPAVAAMADVCLRVGHEWAVALGGDGSDTQAEARWNSVLAGLAVVRPGSSATRRLSDEEVARIAWALRDTAVRDRALELALGADADAAEVLWTECTRRSPAPLDAAPATLLAVSAWLRGNGAMANVALDRALGSEPGYALAGLLDQALAACVPPERLRATLLGAVSDHGHGRGTGRRAG